MLPEAFRHRVQPPDTSLLADRDTGFVLLELVDIPYIVCVERWEGAVPGKLASVVVHSVEVDFSFLEQLEFLLSERRETVTKLFAHDRRIVLSKSGLQEMC